MKKLAISLLVVGMVAVGSPANAGECRYVAFPSTALGLTDGEYGANIGCGLAQLAGLDGACIQNYRDSETGEPCVPDELVALDEDGDDGDETSPTGGGGAPAPGGGGLPYLGPDGCAGSCDGGEEENTGTVTVRPAETVG